MSEHQMDPEEAEARVRQLLIDHDLPQPDEVQRRASGGITCLWYEEKVALIVEDDEDRPG